MSLGKTSFTKREPVRGTVAHDGLTERYNNTIESCIVYPKCSPIHPDGASVLRLTRDRQIPHMLSHGAVHFSFTQELDDKPVWQTDDLGAAAAVTPVHTVVVRAAGFRDGDFAAADGDNIVSVSVFHGETLIDVQIHDSYRFAVAGDLCPGSFRSGRQEEGQEKAHNQKQGNEENPAGSFQERSPRRGELHRDVFVRIISPMPVQYIRFR